LSKISLDKSWFGRCFGHVNSLAITGQGLQFSGQKSTKHFTWQQLQHPPVFAFGWLGTIVRFEVAGQHFVIPYLAYNSQQRFNTRCTHYWISVEKMRLAGLLEKIERIINCQYIRMSYIQTLISTLKSEYERWFPWAEDSDLPKHIEPLLTRLKTMAHWQLQDFSQFNQAYISKQLSTYKTFFDQVETNPLTEKQRLACIIDEDNNLLLAGAGTGKTSVMIARTGYLLASRQACSEHILLLAYGQQAADEMDQRIKQKLGLSNISTRTFHRLGLNIITKVEGRKPVLSSLAIDSQAKSAWLRDCFDSLLGQPAYCAAVLEYCLKYYYVEKNVGDFNCLSDYLSYFKDNQIRTFKGERVSSFAQLYIANWLFCHGIAYQCKSKNHFYLTHSDITIEYDELDHNGPSTKQQRSQRPCIKLLYQQQQSGQLLTQLECSLQNLGVQAKPLPEHQVLASLAQSRIITGLCNLLSDLISLTKGASVDVESALLDGAGKHSQKAFSLLKPILNAYQAQLEQRGEIDFEDMIAKALSYVATGQFISPWRYIMVDEFQDISRLRARLVKALRDSKPGNSIFAVGDDWQAIYRFSGADVTLTTQFKQFFGYTRQSTLDQTFRFNTGISRVATRFVCQNPAQIRKTIHSLVHTNTASVSILRKSAKTGADKQQLKEVANGALQQVLSAISKRQTQAVRVYLLARYWRQLPKTGLLAQLNVQFPHLTLECQTFHGAKGKESDYVIMLGMTQGAYGFPATKSHAPIFDVLLAQEQGFEFAEERRLFYVALTRAKHRVYILVDMADSSVFVNELIQQNYAIELDEFELEHQQNSLLVI
jgi:DNA helicase-4